MTVFGGQWSNGDVSDTVLSETLRRLPSVDEVLGRGGPRPEFDGFPHDLAVEEVRRTIEEFRAELRRGLPANAEEDPGKAALTAKIRERAAKRLEQTMEPSLRPVINATGVILHTNLGRAPLSKNAVAAVMATAGGYSNLEYDLPAGTRGKRDVHAGARLERILGAPAIVVNNNAAAVFLVLEELAHGAEVIVSRGELIEIGDGFRIPDIMARGGARLREVGATNRTRIEDYRAAIGSSTRALLRVHRSNFEIVGFTERPTLEELVALAEESGVPLVEDLGSGCFYNPERPGMAREPLVADSLRAGVDIVTFSGDKLLGGPQAGVIAGKVDWVRRIRRNPLFRALRADKMTYAALDATLHDYQMERWDDIPVLRMLRMPAEEIRARAQRLARALDDLPCRAELVEGASVAGGGAIQEGRLPTTLIAVRPVEGDSPDGFQRRLRLGRPAVVARCEDGRVVLDLRTVFPGEDAHLLERLRTELGRLHPEPEAH